MVVPHNPEGLAELGRIMAPENLHKVELTPELAAEAARRWGAADQPPEFPEFEPTELALADQARAWIEARGGFVIHDGNAFLWFDGDRFCREGGNARLQELFKAAVRQAGSTWKPADHARMGRKASVGGSMSLFASSVYVDRSTLDAHDFLLPCPGGAPLAAPLEVGSMAGESP